MRIDYKDNYIYASENGVNLKSVNCASRLYRPVRRRKAFTLPEILVVVLLISIVTSAVYAFYEIGARSHRNAVARSESISSMRFLQKLMLDKLSRKSDNAYSALFKKNGFSGLSRVQIENIIGSDMHSQSEALYGAAGYNFYQTHSSLGITNIKPSMIINKFTSLSSRPEEVFKGPYLYEATSEAAVAGVENYKISFDRLPSKILASSSLIAPNSASLSANSGEDTLELSAVYKDAAALIGASPPVNISFLIETKISAPLTSNIFNIFFFFDSNTPPAEVLSPNLAEDKIKKYFIESAFIFCGDGLMFYEHETLESYINHALYLETPGVDEAEYDSDGNIIKNIRYAFSKIINGERKVYNDILLKDITGFNLSYYDKNSRPLPFSGDDWQWLYVPKVSYITLETLSSKDGIKNPMKMTFQLYAQY
jgi:prepilin-type N-terminal cleavage/methylation domain-containing protein